MFAEHRGRKAKRKISGGAARKNRLKKSAAAPACKHISLPAEVDKKDEQKTAVRSSNPNRDHTIELLPIDS
jgi:hypothetical protein